MPGMSGFELLSVVRRRFPAVLVIAMSGAFSGDQVPSGVTADAFYPKGNGVAVLMQTRSQGCRVYNNRLPGLSENFSAGDHRCC